MAVTNNPRIDWVDNKLCLGCGGQHCTLDVSGDADATAPQCKLVDCTTVAASVKAKLVSARAWLATLHSDPTATCWLALVRPCDGQKESEGGEDQIDA